MTTHSSDQGFGPPRALEPVLVTMSFLSHRPDELLGVLSQYTVTSRGAAGCRNIDLVASLTTPGRYLVVQKWDSTEAQLAHFNDPVTIAMAEACVDLLAEPPTIDLYDGVSMHDLA
ncbi:MAG: antibiotic biosynthesis monooxygenase [Acidimicrobiales bacterium]